MDEIKHCCNCRYYKELKVIKNDGGKNIADGLGHCSHLDCAVIGNDEFCENGKKKIK